MTQSERLGHSQADQDIWVLLSHPQPGYFVDIGAHDGHHLSNTWLLESSGWTGICAEPCPSSFAQLQNNRTAICDNRAVWHTSGQRVVFHDAKEKQLSGIAARLGEGVCPVGEYAEIEVPTVTLVDLMSEYSAPSVIDYLSLDTEGSEFDILLAHDFDKYKFRYITVEHNWSPKGILIQHLLARKGYVHVRRVAMDDWYVLEGCYAR